MIQKEKPAEYGRNRVLRACDRCGGLPKLVLQRSHRVVIALRAGIGHGKGKNLILEKVEQDLSEASLAVGVHVVSFFLSTDFAHYNQKSEMCNVQLSQK